MPSDDIQERSDLMLSEAASLSLVLARDLQQRALEAEDIEAAARLAAAFTRAIRAMHLSLALQARLGRDRIRLDREIRVSAQAERDERIERRRVQTRTVARALGRGLGVAESISLDLAVDERLREYAVLDADFPDLPVDTLIARIRTDLGLARARADKAGGETAEAAEPPAAPFKPHIPDRDEMARACAALAPRALAVLAEAGKTRRPP